MKMSTDWRLLGLAVAGGSLLAGGTGVAEEPGQPGPWEFNLQASATPVMDSIMRFHDWLLVVITLITLFVLGLLITIVVRFNARAHPVPSRTTHNTLLEVAWTLIPVLILVGIAVRVQVTGADVIHSFAVPAFGIKIDAIPGRLNETWFKATKTGMFYGQCSELCGRDHAFMPIAVRVVSDQEFSEWVETAKKKFATLPGNAYALAETAAQ